MLCKHAAAALYGIGARLDSAPELLFLLRDVNHLDLIHQAVDGANLDAAFASDKSGSLASEDLGELFGIDIETLGDEPKTKPRAAASVPRSKTARSKPDTSKATDHATQIMRLGGRREGTASGRVKRTVKKKVASPKTAAANSTRRRKNAKTKPRKKK